MTENYIRYKSGYKYQLVEEYHVQTNICPPEDVMEKDGFILLTKEGMLTIKQWYAWDGPSGPTRDTPDFMRGSLVHDAFYQLLRQDKLDQSMRDKADSELKRMCVEDGMNKWKATMVLFAVRKWGKMAADPASRKQPISAPPR
ncbi:MAG: hypothetical protein JSU58_01100 [Dehalococcoidales bacterium]|nr:MAG: hypothetical protein JSU58_01100 [Dehalococcoidales bacterium]